MGYDLQIARKENWFDEEQSNRNISSKDWFDYIDKDLELQISYTYQIRNPQNLNESVPVPSLCDWLNHPQNENRWFDYYEGNISSKNPDDHTIRKMLSIAKTLNAKVQGDD